MVKLIKGRKIYICTGNMSVKMIQQLTDRGFFVILNNNVIDNNLNPASIKARGGYG